MQQRIAQHPRIDGIPALTPPVDFSVIGLPVAPDSGVEPKGIFSKRRALLISNCLEVRT